MTLRQGPVPRTRRRFSAGPLWLAAALWLSAPSLLPAQGYPPAPTPVPTVRGSWRIDFNSNDDSFLRLTRKSGKPAGMHSRDITRFRRQDLLGLKRPAGAAQVPVRFQVGHDSGVLQFQGRANASGGAGRFWFEPEEAFTEHMTEGTNDQIYEMALYDVSVEYIRNLQGLGYMPRPSASQLIALRSQGVSIDYVAELKMLGYEKVPVRDLLRMRSSGVTPQFVREQNRPGSKRLTVEELIERSLRARGPDKAEQRKKGEGP